MTTSLPTTRQRILDAFQEHDESPDLQRALTQIMEEDPEGFQAEAADWALRLCERDFAFFNSFVLGAIRIDSTSKGTVKELLRWAEETKMRHHFFSQLYAQVYERDPHGFDTDVANLIEQTTDDTTLLANLTLRLANFNFHLSDDHTTALYTRNPTLFSKLILSQISRSHNTAHIKDGSFPYPNLYAAAEKQGDEHLQQALFKTYASQTEWDAKANDLIKKNADDTLASKLTAWRPPHFPALAEGIVKQLQGLGHHLKEWAEKNTLSGAKEFAHKRIAQALTAKENPAEVMDAIQNRLGWQMTQYTAAAWLGYLYDHAPALLMTYFPFYDYYFSLLHQPHIAELMSLRQTLLERCKADGKDNLWNKLFRHSHTKKEWGAEIDELIARKPAEAELESELARLEIPYTKLSDAQAVALYRLNREVALDFISRHIDRGGKAATYPKLLAMIEKTEDDPLMVQRIFRQAANHSLWEAQMERILAEDIPPDQIVTVLNEWHSKDYQKANPAIMRRFLEKYGEAVLPYLERVMNTVTAGRLRALLDLPIERGELLRELSAMARRQPTEFAALGRLWVPALMERGLEFFDSFIARYIGRDEYVIRDLLPRLEKEGRDALFTRLYGQITTQPAWVADLRKHLADTSDNDTLARALTLRTMTWFVLPDDLAVIIYQRDRLHLGEFIRAHLPTGRNWWRREQNKPYPKLLAEAEKHADQPMIDAINKALIAIQKITWGGQVHGLLQQTIPPDQIGAALERIHPEEEWNVQHREALLTVVKRYGKAAMPYLINHAAFSLPVKGLDDAVKRLGDDTLLWQYRMATQSPLYASEWNQALAHAADDNRQRFLERLALLTPSAHTFRQWTLTAKTANTLYKRYPVETRSFLETFLIQPDEAIYTLADERRDEVFLNYLTYRFIILAGGWVRSSNPYANRNRPPNAAERLNALTTLITARFERLYSESPETFARHTADVFGRFRQMDINDWNEETLRTNNPLFQYLATAHDNALLNSGAAIRDLLESPSVYIQMIAFTSLGKGGQEAAERVIENLPTLRGFLMTRARRTTKRMVLACLEAAAQEGERYTAPIMRALEDPMDMRGRRSIYQETMLAYAKIQRMMATQD